jgi:hypothetical protein
VVPADVPLVGAFEVPAVRYGFFTRPQTMATAVGLVLEWARETIAPGAMVAMPCGDRRFIDWGREHEFPFRARFRERLYVARL